MSLCRFEFGQCEQRSASSLYAESCLYAESRGGAIPRDLASSTLNRNRAAARYIYWVPEVRGLGRWTRYDFLALSLMIRGVLSPGSEALVDR